MDQWKVFVSLGMAGGIFLQDFPAKSTEQVYIGAVPVHGANFITRFVTRNVLRLKVSECDQSPAAGSSCGSMSVKNAVDARQGRAQQKGVHEMSSIVPGRADDLSRKEVEAIFQERLHWSKKHLAASLAAHLEELCAEHRVKKSMVLALIQAESGFRFTANSFKGAVGLMQILPSTAGYVAQKYQIAGYRKASDLHDPFVNLSLGVAYVGYLQKKFTDSVHLIAAYNKGPTAVKREVASRTFELGALKPYVTKVHQEARRLQRREVLTAQTR